MNLHVVRDSRGVLLSIDFEEFSFKINRFFSISVNGIEQVRGRHAHKLCWQVFASQGGLSYVRIRNLDSENEFVLAPGQALVVPPYNWCEVKFESTQTYLNVFASHAYDPNDYIEVEPTLRQNRY